MIKLHPCGDFTVFSIYYLIRMDKEKLTDLFDYLCDTHEKLSSANGRVAYKQEMLVLDDSIESLCDIVKFQQIV